MASGHAQLDVPADAGRRRFYLAALLLFPMLNVALLIAIALSASQSADGPFLAAAGALALGEILFLAHDASQSGIVGWAVLAAMVGNALLTLAGLFVAGYATLAIMCSTGNCPIS